MQETTRRDTVVKKIGQYRTTEEHHSKKNNPKIHFERIAISTSTIIIRKNTCHLLY